MPITQTEFDEVKMKMEINILNEYCILRSKPKSYDILCDPIDDATPAITHIIDGANKALHTIAESSNSLYNEKNQIKPSAIELKIIENAYRTTRLHVEKDVPQHLVAYMLNR